MTAHEPPPTTVPATYPEPAPEKLPPAEAPAPEPSRAMPQILRAAGALLLVVAASTFMFRDWGRGDDVTRYLMLLGQLGMLTFAGFFCGLKLEEKRGARTFLGLVVAVLPVHFAVLGGVLYSQAALDAPASHLATHAVWQAGDAMTAVGLILGAQLLIVPATFVAMMTLVRRHAWQLTAALLGACAVMLIPAREPNTVAVIVAVMIPTVLVLQLRVFSGSSALSTPHGHFVRLMLAAPIFLMIGRTALYYEPTAPFVGVAIFGAGLISFAYDVRADRGRALLGFAFTHFLAIGVMCLGWTAFWWSFGGRLIHGPGRGFAGPLLFLPWAVIVFAASSFTARGTLVYRRLAAALVAGGLCLNVLLFDEVGTSLLSLGGGLALALYGAKIQQKAVMGLGAMTGAVGLGVLGLLTVRLETLTHWGSLTALGVALIFGAALLDRNRQGLIRRLARLQGRMSGWSY